MYMLGDLQRQLGRWTPLSFGIIHVWDRYSLFSIFLEGSSYRESTVISLFGENLKLEIDRKQPLLGLVPVR